MKRDRIEVEWVDSTSWNGWRPLGSVVNLEPAQCCSIGYRCKGPKGFLAMVSSLSDYGDGARTEMIPRGCITSVKKLEVKE